MSDTNGPRRLAVYAVPEAGEGGERKYWPKIGIAFTNRDGSINLILEALPLGTNKLQIREMKPATEARANGSGPARGDFETVEVRS